MASRAVNEEQLSLSYYARQRLSRQWLYFIAAMFADFEERADPTEANQFLEAVGTEMARLLPLRRCRDLEELEADINAVFEGIDWGWMRLRDVGRFIEITHGAYPLVPQDEHRRSWLVPLLEGLYSAWLREQGGDPSIVARSADQGRGALLTFRYGRHD